MPERESTPVVVWTQSDKTRETFRSDLINALDEQGVGGVIFMIHRERELFINANAFESDFVALLHKEQDSVIEQLVSGYPVRAFVVLARGGLQFGSMASPVRFPDWMPALGGRQVPVRVIDASEALDVPLTVDAVEPLARSLYSLDVRLLAKCQAWGHDQDHKRARNSLLVLAREAGDSKGNGARDFDYFLERWGEAIGGVVEPAGYRVERKGGVPSVLSVVYELYQRSAGESLSALASKVDKVFPTDVSSTGGLDLSLAYIQRRVPSKGSEISHGAMYWGNLLTVIGCASNLVTAAHHANDFRQFFSAAELEAVVSTLSRSLYSAAEDLS